MKKYLLYICLFLSAVVFAQESLVKAEVDTTNIRIGEQFEYKISVNETQNVIIPKLEKLTGLEVVDTLKIDTINNKLIRKYILTGFDSGAFYIPRQQIFIKNQAYLTDSLLINVATVPIDTTKIKKFPIKGIKGEPYRLDDFKHYLWWALAILILIAVLVYYFFFRKKKEEVQQEIVPALPPYEEALEKLKNLDEKLLWQNNKTKQYYSELTDIVRGYIERELKIPALENTTDELIGTLTDFKEIDTIDVDKEIIKKLKELLQEADLVKFAKSKPLSHEIEQDRKDAESVINNIKTKPIEVEEDEVE
ncbi:BatD family protein [uncultured Tenacibaculum sp.]|uniref:BatD family protein n=1 Tax=uncultured Tenacibaculum sp. TaxID=174713 RepID=UPI002619030B|nr:BatD family protein [uncultured Tenacibaculum sp.]